MFFFFKQKTAYEMRISDWSSDVCSSDLLRAGLNPALPAEDRHHARQHVGAGGKARLHHRPADRLRLRLVGSGDVDQEVGEREVHRDAGLRSRFLQRTLDAGVKKQGERPLTARPPPPRRTAAKPGTNPPPRPTT